MPTVEIRWRPSGGRGEFEHVPQEVLIGRQIIIDAVSIPNALLTTDAWGRIRDGKPRIRRANPNNRSILNVPQLVAALAWLPEPRREDQGRVALPLRDKGYVISASERGRGLISLPYEREWRGFAVWAEAQNAD